MEMRTAHRRFDPAEEGREHVSNLERRLTQHDRELAAARDRVAGMEAEVAAMLIELKRTEWCDTYATAGNSTSS